MSSVKRSSAYRLLHKRFAGARPPQPSESWCEDGKSYLVFDLIPDTSHADAPPLALFVVHRESFQLLLVRVVTPTNADAMTITDLYREGEESTDDRTS